MSSVCHHHFRQGWRAVSRNPKYKRLPQSRKRQIAGGIARMLERAHGKESCKGKATKIR